MASRTALAAGPVPAGGFPGEVVALAAQHQDRGGDPAERRPRIFDPAGAQAGHGIGPEAGPGAVP